MVITTTSLPYGCAYCDNSCQCRLLGVRNKLEDNTDTSCHSIHATVKKTDGTNHNVSLFSLL